MGRPVRSMGIPLGVMSFWTVAAWPGLVALVGRVMTRRVRHMAAYVGLGNEVQDRPWCHCMHGAESLCGSVQDGLERIGCAWVNAISTPKARL